MTAKQPAPQGISARRPSKPWRVSGPNPLAEHYRSESAAYDAVRELNGWGHAAVVEHWEDGKWRLYERVEPVPPHPEEETGQ